MAINSIKNSATGLVKGAVCRVFSMANDKFGNLTLSVSISYKPKDSNEYKSSFNGLITLNEAHDANELKKRVTTLLAEKGKTPDFSSLENMRTLMGDIALSIRITGDVCVRTGEYNKETKIQPVYYTIEGAQAFDWTSIARREGTTTPTTPPPDNGFMPIPDSNIDEELPFA